MYVTINPVPKFKSCHKAIMVIDGRVLSKIYISIIWLFSIFSLVKIRKNM